VTSATLNLRVSPRRILKPAEAAAYCGMTLPKFKAEFPVAPIRLPGGGEGYDMRDLDDGIDRLKGGGDDTVDILRRLR